MVSLCIISGITFQIIDVPPLLQGIVIFILCLKTIYFIKTASIMASHGVEGSQFSWKYLQSLPISKYELIAFLIISNLFVMLPGIIFFMSFHKLIAVALLEDKDYTFFSTLKILCYIIPGLMLITNISLLAQIQAPRKQFARKHDKNLFLQKMKNCFLYLCAIIYSVFGIIFLEGAFKIEIFKKVGVLITTFENALESPLGLLFILALLMAAISYTIRIWQREELSYTKITWKAHRDVPITMLAIAMIYFPISNISSTDKHYLSHQILQEIHDGNEAGVISLLEKGENPNLKNEYGMTPAIAAALNGKLAILKRLEKFGAKHDGMLSTFKGSKLDGIDITMAAIRSGDVETVKYLLDSGHSADTMNSKHHFYALHAAASSVKMVDLLVSHGANVHVKNAIGETALHVASRQRSWASVVSLQEAGVDPLIKDHAGKVALDYTNSKGDMHYYLQKKSRVPASKGPIEPVK
jgi:hypothetical protein